MTNAVPTSSDAVLDIHDLVVLEFHPRQTRILLLMQQDYDREWSAKSLMERFGWSMGETAYHVRKLKEQRLFRTREARVRGAVQYWHRLNVQTLDRQLSRAQAISSADLDRFRALASSGARWIGS